MKCQYCGNNIGIEDEVCPHCGKENTQAAKHIADMQKYKEDYDKTKDNVIKKSTKFNDRTARIAIIALMIMIVAVMLVISRYYSDFETRNKRNEEKIAKEVEKNKGDIAATLKEMEEHRDYLAMDYYVLNHQLRGNRDYNDYERVFSAAICHTAIYTDIINIVDGYNHYGNSGNRDWCNDMAIYIADWNKHVEGEFWHDSPDSPMHAGEHGAFLADAKKDTQDMVQVYFELTEEQASEMWTMSKDEIADMLYERCKDLYPEVNANE